MDMTIENKRPPTTLSGRRRPRDDDNYSSAAEDENTAKRHRLEQKAAYCGLKSRSAPYKKGRLASFTAAEEAFTRYQIGEFLDQYNLKEKMEADRTGKPVDDARCEELFQAVKEFRQWYETLPYRRRMASLIFLMYQTKMEGNELKHIARGMWNHRIAEGFRVWVADRLGGKDNLHETNRKLRKEHDEILYRECRRVKLAISPLARYS